MKKTKKILIAILAVLLIAAVAVAGILLWPKETAGDNTDSGTDFVIESYPIIPTAYLNQEYDLRDAIEIEEGVTYSATALYVDYNNGMTEHEVAVNDLKLTPVDLFELVVTITAQKGQETAQKVLYVPVSIIADPIDQTFSSKGSAAWADDGIVKTVTIDKDHIKAENSFTALEIAFNGSSSHYYGTALGILKDDDLMKLYSDQKWENAVVQFWVYNPMEAPIEFQLRIQDNQTGLNTDWSDAEDFEYRQIAQPGEWTLCLFSLRAQGTIHKLGNKETLVLKSQYHGMPGLDVNYSYNFVIDGLDIVDASNYPELDTTFTKSTESLDQGWENLPLDTGWQGTETIYVHDIMMGEGSVCSLKATFNSSKAMKDPFISFAPQWAVAYGKLRQLPDMSGGTLTAYFKFENMPAHAELNLTNREWETTNTLPFTLKKLDNGWYEGTIDLYDLEFAAAARSENIVRFNIRFPKASKDSVVYVDTMKFTYKEVNKVKEAATKDWINLPVDSGMNELSTYKYSTSKLKAPGSVRSVYAKAKSNASGKIVFSQEWGVRYKSISSLPDMRTGVLHAYFYFGDQTPKATAQIFNKEWRNSADVDFVFESVGNGWYYGSIPNVLFKGFEKGSAKDIIRIEIGFPAGYSVYIDGLMSNPNETFSQKVDLEDLLGTGIVGVANLSAKAGSKVVTDVTNGSADAMYIYASGDTNYPLLTSRFVLPVDASDWDNLSFDMLADNASTWVGMRVYYQDANGNEKTASAGTDITAGAWNTVSVDLSAFKDVNWQKVTGFGLQFNMDKEDGGLKAGTNKIYIDNWKLTKDAELPADPDDLLGDAILTGGSFHSNPALYQAENDVTVKNGATSTRSWKFSVKEKAWPTAQFTFANVQDLTDKTVQFDIKFAPLANVADPFERIDVMLLGANGASLHAYINNVDVDNGTVTANADGWYTITLDLTTLDIDRTAVHGIQFRLNFDQFEAIYLDNVKLTEQAEAEPEPELPADPDDLLGDATLTGGSFYSNTSLYISENDQTVKNGATSTRSWKFSVTEKSWPTAQFTFANVQDLTGKTVQFDIKFAPLANVADPFERIDVILLGANGTALHSYILNTDVDNGTISANADGWYTVALDLTGLDFDRTAVHGIQFRFNFDQFEAIYVDNMKLVVPAEPEPEPPEFDPEDLIASSVIDPVSGLKVELVTDKTNGSNEALYIHSETPAGYPTVKLMFAEAQDISAFDNLSLDGAVETASKWIGLRLYYLDENGDQKTAGTGIDLTGTEWSNHVVALSSFANADLTKVVGVGLCLNFHVTEGFVTGENNQMWIDNMKLTVNPAPDLNDLLADATMSGGHFVTDPDNYHLDTNSNVVNGAESTRSWKLSAASGWPQAFITFAEKLDLTNKALQFDVKFVEKAGKSNRWIGVYLLDSEGNKLFNSQPVDDCKDGSLTANADGWYTVTLNFGTLDFDRTAAATLYLCFDFDSVDEVYLDNMKLVDWTPPAPKPEFDPADVMPSSQITGITETNALKVTTVTNDTFHSDDAVKVTATAKSSWPVLKIMFEETQDLSDFTELTFAAKSVTASKWLGLRIYYLDANNEQKSANLGIDLSANDKWEHWFVPLSKFSGLDKSKVVGVGFCFNFDDGFVAEQINTVLIDAVGFCGSETVAQDWTNMRVDGGYSAGTYYMDISKAKAKDSVKSLKLEAPSGNAGIAALNPQWAVAEGTLAARPNLTAGTVGAWFYFGTQTPAAGLSVVNSGWAESNAAPFTFGAGENGWYYGTVDVSAITFDNATATAADCFRLCIEVPAGYSVYIDGMTYTKPAASEATEKASDLLATSVNAWPGGGFDGTKNVIDTECTDVYGDQSLYSWKLSTEGADGRNTWPVVQIRLGNAVDLTGKLIAFEVKFESTTARDHYWMSLKSVENSAWSAVTSGSIGKDIYSTDWVTVTFDPSQKLKSGCDLTDVLLLSLCFNFETAEPQAVYIDNLRLIDAQ